MITNFLKLAWRNLLKNRVSAIINVCGLALGMAVAIIIGLWIYDELSFNTWHKNYDRIARVEGHWFSNGPVYTGSTLPMPLGQALRDGYGEYFSKVILSTTSEQHLFSTADKHFSLSGYYIQPDGPELFSLHMLEGSRDGLREPNSILLSSTDARKFFGNADALGKLIRIDTQFVVKVTGVYEDLPANSTFSKMAFLLPFDLYLSSFDWARKKYIDWNNTAVNIYLQLRPGADVAKASDALKGILAPQVKQGPGRPVPELFIEPMSRWHLFSTYQNGKAVTSDALKYVRLYGTIGIFVLLLACINFMNLSTARSERRAKEVGIRKTMGSIRSQLISQFFCESIVVSSLAFLLALFIVWQGLPFFNDAFSRKITIPWLNPWFWSAALIFIGLTGLLAGSYPALYLSSFNPVAALKGTFRTGRFSATPRQILVVLQFTISVILAIGTITIYRQITYAKDRPVGYSRESLVQIPLNSPEYQGRFDLFRNALKKTGAVEEVAESASPVTGIYSTNNGFTWPGNKNTMDIDFATIDITHDYGKVVGWQFDKGRDFSRNISTDSMGLVINEAAVKTMNLPDPVGEYIQWDQAPNMKFKILGVVTDMVMKSPYEAANPTIFFIFPRDGMNFMLVRLNPAMSATTAISRIQTVFKRLAPQTPLDFTFVDEDFNHKFATEEQTGRLVGLFSTLAIVISCLGLFGLSSFIAEQRTREIGIRKVVGASAYSVWRLLCMDFLVLILIAILIAAPISYYFSFRWLENYVYRSAIAWWVFVLAGLGAVFVTLLTVSYQTIRASLANPAKSLRTE